jgi:alkaline phosphatase
MVLKHCLTIGGDGEGFMLIHRSGVLLITALACAAAASAVSAQPKNVIFMIGDGMGPVQVEAAEMFAGAPMSFEAMPYQGQVTTYAANNAVTDSAAAATAMATSHKVNNGVISLALPGDGSELYTLLEHYQSLGRDTGLVTTTYMTHATPAAFGAHETSRNNNNQIASDYLNQTKPNVLFGGGANGMSVGAAQLAGYNVVTDAAGMLALNTNTETFVSGQFGSTHLPYEADGLGTLPHLSQMTTTALDILDNDPDGFFLMVEGGRIDHAGHSNHIERNIGETIEFSNTVQSVLDWAAGRDDTLVIVTADHETGGLSILADNGPGALPTVSWSTTGHTAVNIPVYAFGANANRVKTVMNNTDFFDLVTVADLAGDLNSDGFVGIADLNIIMGNWNLTAPSGSPLADPTGDGFVGIEDLNTVLGNWNTGTPPSSGVIIPEPTSVIAFVSALLATFNRRSPRRLA